MRTILILCSLAALATAASGCGPEADSSPSDFEVVATTPVMADLVAGVEGESATVRSLLPLNADPHDFEPSPSDTEALLDAGLIVRSGGGLDLWLDELLDGAGSDAPILDLTDAAASVEGVEDPHWWLSPPAAIAAVEAIRDALADADADRAAIFERNADGYIERLEALDREIEGCVEHLPRERRMLVTRHDALGSYAERYGFEVLGAASPALTTQAQASAGATAELVQKIRDRGAVAVFPEAGVSAGLEAAIAEEAGVELGPQLWVDTLGAEGSGAETYVKAMATNTLGIVAALSAGEIHCRGLEAIATG